METDEVTEVIAANHALAQRLRINGTPAFIMDDHMLRGFLPQDQMQAIADEIRSN
jgi:protein-disulfide isomerase